MLKAIAYTLSTAAILFFGSYMCLEANIPKWSVPPTATVSLVAVWIGIYLSVGAWMEVK